MIPARERAWIFGLLIAPSAVAMNGIIQGGVLSCARYSIINSLGNIPVLYMLQVDGWGGDHGGGRGLAAAEAVVGGVGAVALLACFLIRAPARTYIASEPVPATG